MSGLSSCLAGFGRRCRQGGETAEGGFVSFYVVLITIGLLAMCGLVFDGGNALAARGQAADVSQQAARAGADALSPASLRSVGPVGLTAGPAAAGAAANRVLRAGGVSGTVAVSGDTVTVAVVVHRRTSILSAVGLTQITGRATASATAIHGTTAQTAADGR